MRVGDIFRTFEIPQREVDKIFLHCSATSNQRITAVDIDQWHRDRGWSGIGYHLFICSDGKIEYGRSMEESPAAQDPYNMGTIAICVNGLVKDDFENILSVVFGLCYEINKAYRDVGRFVTFHGHCEISHKLCPVFDYKKLILLDEYGHFGEGRDGVSLDNADMVVDLPMLRLGDVSTAVVVLQGYLHNEVAHKSDGIFGRETESAVKEFQESNHLTDDGVVGPDTWTVLLGV